MQKRRLLKWFLVLMSPFLLVVLFLVVEHVRGAWALGKLKKQLLAQGVILDPVGFNSSGGPDNDAPAAVAAIQRLSGGTLLEGYPPRMARVESGHAIVGFREKDWPNGKQTISWADLAADVETNAITLDEIQVALQKPVLDNRLDFSQAPSMSIIHVVAAKKAAQAFNSAASLSFHNSRQHEGAENLMNGIRAARLLERDRIIISELVRVAMGAIATGGIWEALQAEWSDGDLAAIQEALAGVGYLKNMRTSMEGERVFQIAVSKTLRTSPAKLGEWITAMDGIDDRINDGIWATGANEVAKYLRAHIYPWIWKFAWSDQYEYRSLWQLQELMELFDKGIETKSLLSLKPGMDELAEEFKPQNAYDRLRFPLDSNVTLIRCVTRAMRAETERSMALTAMAIKRHTLRFGHSPANLEDLVPTFLASVPIDYMDGKPVKYIRQADGSFTLYSVGEDGVDGRGDVTLNPGAIKGSANLWLRKDYVWPAPATPEEVEEYHRKALGKSATDQ